jgi:hypothetical protein
MQAFAEQSGGRDTGHMIPDDSLKHIVTLGPKAGGFSQEQKPAVSEDHQPFDLFHVAYFQAGWKIVQEFLPFVQETGGIQLLGIHLLNSLPLSDGKLSV